MAEMKRYRPPRITMHKQNVTDIRYIKKENLPYIIAWIVYYAWVIFFTTWWTASPFKEAVNGTHIRSYLHQINLLSSIICIFIFKKNWFAIVSKAGMVCLSAVALLFIVVGHNGFHLGLIILFGAALGIVNAGILMSFVFIINNTEKFYCVVGANLLIGLLALIQSLNIFDITGSSGVSFAMLLICFGAVMFFKKKDIEKNTGITAPLHDYKNKTLFLTCLLNVLYAVFCKGVGKAFLSLGDAVSFSTLTSVFYMAAVAGCLLYTLIYAVFKKANHTAWNVTLGSFIIALLFYALRDSDPDILLYSSFFNGIASTMGMINMYYIVGVIGKKYNSLKYVRFSVLFIGIGGGVFGVAFGNMLLNASAKTLSAVVIAVSCAVVLVLLVISPALSESYFNDEWAKDSCRKDVDNEKLYRYAAYHLSAREIQVCRLLEEGYTLRQTAAMLRLSYNTVNTYCTSIYRKMNINSRIELVNLLKKKE